MENLCQSLLTMTLTSTFAAAVVMALRLVLPKRVPREFICALWLVVILRMLWPFGFPVGFVSLIPKPVTSGQAAEVILDRNRTDPAQAAPENTTQSAAQSPEAPAPVAVPTETPRTISVTPAHVLGAVWMAGTAGMLLWTALSYRRLRRQVAEAVRTEGDVFESDAIDAPFVFGKRVYLPAGLGAEDRRYVLLHERAHVARHDALKKGLAWIALAVHWFNPALWLAYRLFCRDVEAACDQKVLVGFAPETRREDTAGYAEALLHLGRRTHLPQTVLPFGEENAKGRIRNVLSFHPPGKAVAAVIAVLCAAVVCLLTMDWPEKEVTQKAVFAGNTILFAELDEELCHIEGEYATPIIRSVSIPYDLQEELFLTLESADCRSYSSEDALGQDPALAGWTGTAEKLTGDSWAMKCCVEGPPNSEYCVLYGWGNETVLWADSERKNYMLFPDVKQSAAFQAWEAHLNEYLTVGRAEALYDLSKNGNSLRVIDRVPGGLLYETGIRYFFLLDRDAMISMKDRKLTVHLQENEWYVYDDPPVFQQIFDQYLREASLRTIALLDNVDEIDYIYSDGSAGPVVRLELPGKPSLEQFTAWYIQGIDGQSTLAPQFAEEDFLLDGYPIDSVSVAEPLFGPNSQSVEFPEELVRELLAVLQAHPHEAYHGEPETAWNLALDLGKPVDVAEGYPLVDLHGDRISRNLYLYSDGTALLYNPAAGQLAKIHSLGKARDFKTWQKHARQWLKQGRGEDIYDSLMAPDVQSLPPEKQAEWLLEDLGVTAYLDRKAPVAVLENGVLRVTLVTIPQMGTGVTLNLNLGPVAEGDLADDFQVMLDHYLNDVCRLTMGVIKEIHSIVFCTPDGIEFEVKGNGETMTRAQFAKLYSDSYQERMKRLQAVP